jgi:flagellar hook-basal body complex protein FliE
VTLASFQTSDALPSAIIFDMRQTLKRAINKVVKKEKKTKKVQESGMCINSDNIANLPVNFIDKFANTCTHP